MVLTHPNLSFRKLFPSLIAIREGAGGELKIAIRDDVIKEDGRVKVYSSHFPSLLLKTQGLLNQYKIE